MPCTAAIARTFRKPARLSTIAQLIAANVRSGQDSPNLRGARAPEVRVLKLQPAGAAATVDDGTPIERLGIGGEFYVITAAKDATEARGLSNIRRAMVLDASYDWAAANEAAKPRWQYAMEFAENGQRVMVLFDFESRRVGTTASAKTTVMRTEAAADWQKFFEEQWGK